MSPDTYAATSHYLNAPRLSLRAIVLIVAAHAGVLTLLAMTGLVPTPAPISTLMVDLIHAAPPAPRTQEPEPPKPVPREQKPVTPRPRTPVPQPLLAAQTDAPAAIAETPGAVQAPISSAPSAPPAPVTVSQPRFDADYLSNPAPAYPPLSRRMGEEGKVLLRVHVEPAGRPSQIEVKTTSGSPRLDQAALEAVWRWKFVPAKRGDEAVAAWVLVPITFTLKN